MKPNSWKWKCVRAACAVIVPAGGVGVAPGGTARYEVTFSATWSAQTHPQDFPVSAHFSGLIGGTHHAGATFWQDGALATAGIENMAELGSKFPLTNEVQAAISSGTAWSVLSGGGISRSPGSVVLTFDINDTHSLVTLVSMVAPSPDWFVGVDGLEMRPGGQWRQDAIIDLYPWDSGTDSGVTFTSPDLDTQPRELIHDLSDTYPFTGTGRLGTFTFRLLPRCPGDADGDGAVDQDDLDLVLFEFGNSVTTRTHGDANGNGAIDQDDLDVVLFNFGATCP